jgi:hypothetical protein
MVVAIRWSTRLRATVAPNNQGKRLAYFAAYP